MLTNSVLSGAGNNEIATEITYTVLFFVTAVCVCVCVCAGNVKEYLMLFLFIL